MSIQPISLVCLSLAVLLAIPMDMVWVQSWKPNQTGAAVLAPKAEERAWKSEAQFLRDFETTTLFGRASQNADDAAVHQSLTELVKDLRLKGVILGDKPEAIIWNAKTQKTIFIKKNGATDGLVVKDIRKGSVILTSGGEDIELQIK